MQAIIHANAHARLSPCGLMEAELTCGERLGPTSLCELTVASQKVMFLKSACTLNAPELKQQGRVPQEVRDISQPQDDLVFHACSKWCGITHAHPKGCTTCACRHALQSACALECMDRKNKRSTCVFAGQTGMLQDTAACVHPCVCTHKCPPGEQFVSCNTHRHTDSSAKKASCLAASVIYCFLRERYLAREVHRCHRCQCHGRCVSHFLGLSGERGQQGVSDVLPDGRIKGHPARMQLLLAGVLFGGQHRLQQNSSHSPAIHGLRRRGQLGGDAADVHREVLLMEKLKLLLGSASGGKVHALSCQEDGAHVNGCHVSQ